MLVADSAEKAPWLRPFSECKLLARFSLCLCEAQREKLTKEKCRFMGRRPKPHALLKKRGKTLPKKRVRTHL
jgi:hypothetical protein